MTNRRINILSFLVAVMMTTLVAAQMPRPMFEWDDFAERHDLDGDGRVTSEELAATSPRISRLDADGDGAISEADFDSRRAEMATLRLVHMADNDRDGQVGTEEWTRFQEALDPDGDGAFEISDFHNLHNPNHLKMEKTRRLHPGNADERFRGRSETERTDAREQMADVLDLDRDGQLSSNDLDLLFLSLDDDGDGVLQVQSFHPRPRFGSEE